MRLAVVGDLLLDHDLAGPSTRLSPDAQVPVVEVERSGYRAGGAGLVARLLAADGHEVVLVSVLGDDAAGHRLRAALDGIELACGPSRAPTPVKTRVHANGQAVVRFDQGCARPPLPVATPGMLDAIRQADAVIVADYGRRLAENLLIRRALEAAARTRPVIWDPHPAGATPIPGCRAVTPNHVEAAKFSGSLAGGRGGDPHEAATALHAAWGSPVVVTLGSDGALVHDGGKTLEVGADAVDSADPCGAGDRFAGALTVALAAGHALPQAVEQAVKAAGAFLAAGGVNRLPQPAGRPREHAAPAADDQQSAWRAIEQVRAAGGTVVATGGCFDLLHAGHTRTLQQARELGDCLVVLLNSDDSVRRLKGAARPIIAQQDRVEMLLALQAVDGVLVFEQDTPDQLLKRIRPDIWVKGGDYDAAKLPEAPLVSSWGGRTVIVPYRVARSTTSLAAALCRVG